MSSLSALNSLLGNTNAIDLSTILQAAMGSMTPGIDVNSAVNAAVSAAQGPELDWENQQATLQSQMSALNQIQSYAGNLDGDLQSLNNLTGPLSSTVVTSSAPAIVTASSASGTVTGNNTVVVNSLATTDTWASTTAASSSTALPAGTLTITPASGTAATITIGSGVNTLSDLATAINGDNLGVTASVITDATGARLSIVSNSSGSASNFSVSTSSPSTFGMTQAVTGANASLTVNGIAISSSSNTVTGAIPGVTLNLLSASSTPVTLSVAPDTTHITTAINQFVSDYNTAIQAVNAQYADSGSGEGVLATDPTLRSLQTDLLQAVDYTYTPASGSTTVPNLSSLGITVNKDGTLSVDSATLNSALQNNFSDVKNFFQGTALNGFAGTLDQQLTSFLNPGDGAFTVDLQSMNTESNALQTDITNFQTNVIGPLKTQMQAEYSQAEVALQQLPSEIRNVDAELGMYTSQQQVG